MNKWGISVRVVKSLAELKMPKSHRIFLEHLLEYLKSYPVIEKVLLFGSCAKGEATQKSDIDLLLLGSGMTDEDEWNIAWNCPKWDGIEYVPYDLISGTLDSYGEMSNIPGMVQHSIKLRGVDLTELLFTR